MCLTTDISSIKSRDKVIPYIASTNIDCWKLLRSDFSPCVFTLEKGGIIAKYEKGESYKEELEFKRGKVFWEITRGFHSFSRPSKQEWGMSLVYEQMLIPKGSKYFMSRDQYVSDSIHFPLIVLKKRLSHLGKYE